MDDDEYNPGPGIGHEDHHEREGGHDEYQPELDDGHDEYQPEMRAEHEYEIENEAEEESDPEEEEEEVEEADEEEEDDDEEEEEAEEDGDNGEEEEAGQEYIPEHDGAEEEAGQEYLPEHEVDEEYQPGPLTEEEYQPIHESELVYEQDQEHEHNEEDIGIDDEMPENSHADEKQENDVGPVAVTGGKWPGWPGESVFRMLVAAQKVGSIIGRKGEYIKKTCEETKARIKILEAPPGCRERAVMVSAKEEPDTPCPPAVEGLLHVYKRVLDGMENDSSVPTPSLGGKISTRLLVPATQAGSLIGKQGTTVKSIQEESNCIVRVLDELPVFALQDDRVVEVVGEATATHKALELIATHLRKFLVDRSIISVIEMQMQTPSNPPMDHMAAPQNWGPSPQSFPQTAHGGPAYGASPRFMPQSRQYDNYYSPADMPPQEKQAHQGISAYGREAPMSMHSSSGLTPSVITQVTQQMQIPLSYADAVIGTQGSSISYIRRVSGATVTIQETRGVPTEMTVEISGSASQVQTAQQLIQNFMAQAAAAAAASTQQQNPPSAASDQMYGSSSYGTTALGSAYVSNPQIGGYSSTYGNNYSY